MLFTVGYKFFFSIVKFLIFIEISNCAKYNFFQFFKEYFFYKQHRTKVLDLNANLHYTHRFYVITSELMRRQKLNVNLDEENEASNRCHDHVNFEPISKIGH